MNMGVVLSVLAVVLIAAVVLTRRFVGRSVPVIPILMFHKVDDAPTDPECITSEELEKLFTSLWEQGFCPVNMSDIVMNRVDSVVPAGRKPVALTADDAHPSMLFSRRTKPDTASLRNSRSFVEVLTETVKPFGLAPRASLFLGRIWDDRACTEPGDYFDGCLSLGEALAMLEETPGVEAGYHTVAHKSMANIGAAETRAIVEEQRRDFDSLGVLDKVVPIMAYPYGHRPSPEGLVELERLGFLGAVVTIPGLYGRPWYRRVPQCAYDGALVSERFTLPRVSVGSYAYPRKAAAETYVRTDPLAVFTSDVLDATAKFYVVQGETR